MSQYDKVKATFSRPYFHQ